MERLGRARLQNGREGAAPVVGTDAKHLQEVAIISVHADSLATPERLLRHLQRRASLMGCTAITGVRQRPNGHAQATCLTPAEGYAAPPARVSVSMPSRVLLESARAAGPRGLALLQVLEQMHRRPPEQRVWLLQWYQKTYPHSPFASDVEALFVHGVPDTHEPDVASVRMAASAP